MGKVAGVVNVVEIVKVKSNKTIVHPNQIIQPL
jgi:hypothetical protein